MNGSTFWWRSARASCAGVLWASLAWPAQAAEHRFQVLLDADKNAATGCTVATSKGPAAGIEQVWTTVVTTTTSGATVSRIERQTCSGASLTAPNVFASAGWSAGIGNGTSGTAAIETYLPLSALTNATLRALVASTNASGGQDSTASFPIVVARAPAPQPGQGAQAIPLSPWLVPLLGIVLLGVAGWCRKRLPGQGPLLLCIGLVAVSGLAWAATVILDGNVGDWSGVAPDAVNSKGSAPIDANIVAVFHQSDANNLYFRIDADVRPDAVANQPPNVDAGSDQTITLPTSASLSGSASDDGLPNPPGTLTTTWSKSSGPGTVSFGDINALGTTASFSAPGVYVLRLTASDGALSASDDVQVTVNPAANQPPVTHDDSVATTVGVAVSSNVLANDSDPNGDTLTVSAFTQGANGSVSCLANGQCTYTPNAGFSGQDAFTYTADDGHGAQTPGQVTVTVAPGDLVAAPVDPSVTTTVANSTQFLYSGPNAVQSGVAPGTIAPVRAAVLRGAVTRHDGSALAGATITILGHPEFGQTASRGDGRYDMAVNGGGTLTMNYAAAGFLPAQRQVNVPWQDYVVLPDVALQALDGQATTIVANAPTMQVHRGSLSSDADGNRRATVLFPAGMSATMVMPDGSMQPLPSFTVRATEFTVGPGGKRAMPAQLPPTSAYTYAVSFSADEAVAAGATSVVFSQPVIQYSENFLNFPVGVPVPTGVYDLAKSAWLAIPDGRVIKILSVTAGLADVDSDGDGIADDALGLSSDERHSLATLYTPGQTLWRTPLPHFSYVDNNWGFIPADSTPPTDAGPVNDDPLQDPETCHGCIVEIENQALGESVPIVGTPFTLNYRSDREPGHARARTIQLSGETLPPQLASIGLSLSVAGQTFEQTFQPTPDQSYRFVWDGKDAYGRTLQGGQALTGSIDYHYPAIYAANPASGTPSFGAPPGPNAVLLEGFRDGTYATSRTFSTTIGEGLTDARALGLGGWTLSVQHFFDPIARVLHMGDGTRRRADSLSRVINTFLSGPANGSAGSLVGTSIAVAPDGSTYFLRQKPNFTYTVNRLSPDGTEAVVAGNGNSLTPPFGDDGPAINASDIGPPLAVGLDGSIYVQSQFVIRRIGPDGIIHRFAGRYPAQVGGSLLSACDLLVGTDGVPATDTDLCPIFFSVAPDGSAYISEHHQGGCDVNGCSPEFARVRRVGADGIITTVAGTTAGVCDDFFDPADCDDGAPAIAARLGSVGPVQVSADGTLYLVDFDRIKRIGPDGTIHTMAQGVTNCFNFTGANAIALGPNGSVYAANFCGQIVQAAPDGTVTVFAGTLTNPNNGAFVRKGDGGPALTAGLGTVDALAGAPDGTIVLASSGSLVASDGTLIPGSLATAIRRIGTFLPGISAGEFSIASDGGTELYVFGATGLHLRTLDALTGAMLYEFAYNANGLLSQVTQKTGGTDNVTTIEHDASGNPTAIVGPFGQRTLFGVDANGFLASIANPAGETLRMASDANGLMTAYTDARGKASRYVYDAEGHLIQTNDPVGGGWTLGHSLTPPGTVVVGATSALGRASTYEVDNLAGNVQRRLITAPDGTTTQSNEAIDAASSSITVADGSATFIQQGPDPQFFMNSPIEASFSVTLPSALALAGSSTRTAVRSNASDPLSLVSLTSTSTVDSRTATSSYLAATRTFSATTPMGRTSSTTLDGLGRLASGQFGSLAPFTVGYDNRGRVASVTRAGGPETRTVSLAYNADGYLQSITDPLGRTAQYAYDAAGRVVSKTLPDGRIVAFGYDAAGNMTSFTPPGRPAYGFTYSDRGELTGVTPPLVPGGGPIGYAYDLDRMPTVMTRPDARTVTFGYDAAGRIATRTFATGGVAAGTDVVAYDGAGRLANAVAASGESTSYAYDGSLLTSKSWSGPVTGSVSRSFDTGFRVATESINAASTIAFAYDDDNLLIGAGDASLTHDQNGLATGTGLGNVTTSSVYNPFGEVTGYSASSAGAPIFSESFTRDALGRIVQKVETIGGASDTYAYAYDLAGQLTSVARNGATVESYVYDANGNRTGGSVGGSPVTATYDEQDRLTQYGASTFAYSAAGDLLSKTVGAQTTSYQYDAVGNLQGVVLPSGTTVGYVVDANNRRVGKRVDGTLVKGFLYGDALRIAAELDGAGGIVSRFVYAGSRVPLYMTKSGTSFRIIPDAVGSVRLVVNAQSGAIVQRMDYDAFGNVVLDTNPGFQPFGFAGGLYDPDTGLLRFGARDYDATIGRWTTKDPLLLGGADSNLYRYVQNDPVNRTDPHGLGSALDTLGGYLDALLDSYAMMSPVDAYLLRKLDPGRLDTDYHAVGIDSTSSTFFWSKFISELIGGSLGCPVAVAAEKTGNIRGLLRLFSRDKRLVDEPLDLFVDSTEQMLKQYRGQSLKEALKDVEYADGWRTGGGGPMGDLLGGGGH